MGIMSNFADAILDGKPLIAPAGEGLNSVELGNAMLLSSFTENTIQLPMDASAFENVLKEKTENSSGSKKAASKVATEDFSKSFT